MKRILTFILLAPRNRNLPGHAMNVCREFGCYKLTLSSNMRREKAHRFFENLGFERHGYNFLMEIK